jgi:hypothetical protein
LQCNTTTAGVFQSLNPSQIADGQEFITFRDMLQLLYSRASDRQMQLMLNWVPKPITK